MGKNFLPPSGDGVDNLGKPAKRWNNIYLAGSVVGATNVIDDLDDVTITSPSDGEVLTYDSASSDWVNEAVPKSKIYVATGNTDISTSSTTFVDMTDMSITETFDAGKIYIHFYAGYTHSSANFYIRITLDGVEQINYLTTGSYVAPSICWACSIAAGSHTIKVQWRSSSSSYTVAQDGATYKRILTIITGQ